MIKGNWRDIMFGLLFSGFRLFGWCIIFRLHSMFLLFLLVPIDLFFMNRTVPCTLCSVFIWLIFFVSIFTTSGHGVAACYSGFFFIFFLFRDKKSCAFVFLLVEVYKPIFIYFLFDGSWVALLVFESCLNNKQLWVVQILWWFDKPFSDHVYVS